MVGFYKNIEKYKKLWGSKKNNKNIRKSNNDKNNNNTY